MKLYKHNKAVCSSTKLQHTSDSWSELLAKIEKDGYRVDSINKHKPSQWITAYKDGNEYEIEVTKYSDGTYEVATYDWIGEIQASSKMSDLDTTIIDAEDLIGMSKAEIVQILNDAPVGSKVIHVRDLSNRFNRDKEIIKETAYKSNYFNPISSPNDFKSLETYWTISSREAPYIESTIYDAVNGTSKYYGLTSSIVRDISINAANDVGYESNRDIRLDPINYDGETAELETITQTIDLTLNRIEITINDNGTWDYSDETFSWINNTTFDEELEIELEPAIIVEDFDRIVEPYLPMDPGTYFISCDASLIYDIYNIFQLPDGTIDTTDIEVDFNVAQSSVFNFKYSEKI